MIANKSKLLVWIGYLFVFLIAFFPRVYMTTTRFMQWYNRSYFFWEGLRSGDFAETYQQYHPGVTTMWVSGIGTEVYRLLNGLETDDIPSSYLTNPLNPAAYSGLIAMGLVIAGSIVLVVFLLSRVTSWTVSFAAGYLLAIDPFYIAHSQQIHVDAFVATFMLLSALAWLVFLRRKTRVYLLISAIFGGFALLTKSPAFYLLPFVGLTAFIQAAVDEKFVSVETRNSKGLVIGLRRLIVPLVVWFAVAAITVVLVWPSLWVEPTSTINRVFDGVFLSSEQSHEVDQFFAGEIISEDPGFLFYVASLGWHTTALSLIGSILALYFIIRKRRTWDEIQFWLFLLIFIVGFVFMMTLAEKKWERYLLPSFVAIVVLATWGIVNMANLAAKRIKWPAVNWRTTLFLVLALLAQTILVLRHHPYYGTHFNQLLGGTRVAQNIMHLGLQGEGMDLAAKFLNSLRGADRLRVATQPGDWLMYQKNFKGLQVKPEEDPQFMLFHINHIQRPVLESQIQTIWDNCQQEGSTWSAAFDGVPYVWLCPTYETSRADYSYGLNGDIHLGDHIDLIGFGLDAESIRAGETLTVNLHWQSDGLVQADNHVFVHLIDEDGSIISQHDGAPAFDWRPTWNWLPDEIITDVHPLTIPISTKEGTYTLFTGMYDFDTLARLPVIDESGSRFLDDRIKLETIEILPP